MQRKRKRLLLTLSLAGVFLLALHGVISFRSKEVLNALLKEFTGGRYAVHTAEVDLSYFPLSIEIDSLRFFPVKPDTRIEEIRCDHLVLTLEKTFDFIFFRKIDLREFSAVRPQIVLNEEPEKRSSSPIASHSIAGLQRRMLELFDQLKAEKVRLTDASLRINQLAPGGSYFSINHINLSLDDFHLQPAGNSVADPFKGEASFGLSHPEIHLADTALTIKLDELLLDKSSGALKMDSLAISRRDDELQDEGLRLASVAVKNFNWSRFLEEGTIEIDSAIVLQGDASINLSNRIRPSSSKPKRNKSYTGNLLIIHHVAVKDISYSMLLKDYLKKGDGKVNFKISGDKLELKELRLDPESIPFASVKEIDVRLKDYSEIDSQNLYTVSLGSVKFTDGDLVLKDYLLQPRKDNNPNDRRKISVPALSVNRLSLPDLLLKRAVAARLTVDKPEIVLNLTKNNQRKSGKLNLDRSVRELLSGLKDKVDIGQVTLNDGSIRLHASDSSGQDIVLSGVALKLNGKKAVESNNLVDALQSIDELKSDGFSIKGPQTDIIIGQLRWLKDRTGLKLSHVKGRIGKNTNVTLNTIEILFNTKSTTKGNQLTASLIKVSGGTMVFHSSDKKNKSNPLPLLLGANRVVMDSIHIQYASTTARSATSVNSVLAIQLNDLRLGGAQPLYSSIKVSGWNNLFSSGKTTVEAKEIEADQPGTILFHDVKGANHAENHTIDFSAALLSVGLTLDPLHPGNTILDAVTLDKPKLEIGLLHPDKKKPGATTSTSSIIPPVHRLRLHDPEFVFHATDSTGKRTVYSRAWHGELELDSFAVVEKNTHPVITVAQVDYVTDELSAEIAQRLFDPSSLHVNASRLFYDLHDKSFECTIDHLKLNGFHHRITGKKQDTLDIRNATLDMFDVHVHNELSLEMKKLLAGNNWNLSDVSLDYTSASSILRIDGLFISHTDAYRFGFDSLLLQSKNDRNTFWKSQPFEKDYLRIRTGRTSCQHAEVNWEQELPEVHLPSVEIHDLCITPERDKTRPEDTVSYRPLLARQLRAIPFPIVIDTVTVNGGSVAYHEIGRRTAKEGILSMDGLNGSIYNIRNHSISTNDSLIVRLSASLYGSGSLRMNFRQSYTDTLQGFRMRIRMKDFEMPKINELLSPLMRLQMRSGKIDTLTLVVKGNDLFSYGTINMNYDNLSVHYLGKNEDEQFFMNGPLNWLVNQFIRSNDEGRTNLLFRRRARKRGQFNFWGKIAMEGLLSDIGLKRDDAERKAFEKTIKEYELPGNYWYEE